MTPQLPRSHHDARLAILRDGTTVLLREQRHDDREHLAALFAGLSSDARYLRFGTGMPPELPAHHLEVLAAVDDQQHVGVFAVHAGRVVAAGRFIRTPAGGAEADVALTVTDAFQGRGLGGLLADELIARARARGITRLTFDILAFNRRARALARAAGADPDAGFLELAAADDAAAA